MKFSVTEETEGSIKGQSKTSLRGSLSLRQLVQ